MVGNMSKVGSYEAKTHLPQLLNRVQQGEEITITRRGVPIAKLVPVNRTSRKEIQEAIEEIRRLRKGFTTGGISIKEMIEQGRKY